MKDRKKKKKKVFPVTRPHLEKPEGLVEPPREQQLSRGVKVNRPHDGLRWIVLVGILAPVVGRYSFRGRRFVGFHFILLVGLVNHEINGHIQVQDGIGSGLALGEGGGGIYTAICVRYSDALTTHRCLVG